MADGKFGRRALIGGLAGAAGVVVLGAAGDAAASVEGQAGAAGSMKALPWPYVPLDPDVTADRAFEAYKKGHCMYAVAEAILGQYAEKLGAPYDQFPLEMYEYGKGGVFGWGTLCGCANGAAAIFKLLAKKPADLTTALYTWYESEPLPNYVPKAATHPNFPVIAGGVLCHLSVSHWCEASGKKSNSPERAERCGALAASVARKAVQLLAAEHAGEKIPVALSERAQFCGGCHETGGFLENTRSKMDCTPCHWSTPGVGKVHGTVQRGIRGMKDFFLGTARADAGKK
jgi:hypothetical protein